MMMTVVLVMIIMMIRMRSMMNINFVVIFFISLGEASFDDGWNISTKEQVSRFQIFNFHLNCLFPNI